VELSNVAACAVPFTRTFDNVTKFVPFMLRAKMPLPVSTAEGEMLVMCGSGLEVGLIVKLSGAVIPPPGEGVETVIAATAAFSIKVEDTCAVSEFVFTNRLLSAVPFQSTVEAGVKL
jgi:hypothetical protein